MSTTDFIVSNLRMGTLVKDAIMVIVQCASVMSVSVAVTGYVIVKIASKTETI